MSLSTINKLSMQSEGDLVILFTERLGAALDLVLS